MTAAAEILSHTVMGVTVYSRWLGRCSTCKSQVRVEGSTSVCWFLDYDRVVACECGAAVKVKIVTGRASDKECDDRCLSAKRSTCECSCAGANHGVRQG